MALLVVQLVVWVFAWGAGVAGFAASVATPVDALRISLAAMFTFTAVAHFVPKTRTEMLAMVPPALPTPGMLVSLTGGLELAGRRAKAIGPRLGLQLFWIACLPRVAVAAFGRRAA